MKIGIALAGLLLLATLSGRAGEAETASSAELANEAADLPFHPRHLALYTVLFAVLLAFALLVLMEVGRRVGTRHLTPDISETRKGLAAVDGFVFSLLGLLVAFAFHGAAERFDARRRLVIQEAESISTAWQRLDLLTDKDRLPLQELFRQYVDNRIGVYRKLPGVSSAKGDFEELLKLQDAIWRRSIDACREPSPAATHLIPALNQMFGLAHTRVEIARIHPPGIIFGILIALTLVSALLVGHGMAGRKSRSWTHIFGFVITMAAAIYLIFELEHPRLGLIRIDAMDQVLVDLRQTMK
jgi:hypothetical protein